MKTSLRALLAGSIDYAGLFPPATLPLETALKSFDEDFRSEHSWMLSTFVLPISKFSEAIALRSHETQPLPVSALGSKTNNESEFARELRTVENRLSESVTSERLAVKQLEMLIAGDVANFSINFPLQCFWEASAENAEGTIARLARINSSRTVAPFGFKLRTGGVTADAFPDSAQIARALLAASRHKVPIKFTAGLHHPVRMFRDEVKTKMHGFLNVLGAGVFAIEHGWDEKQTVAILDDEDTAAFRFSDESFSWRDFEVPTSAIENHRAIITSFGSCSFDEPREDLRALNLL